MNEDAYKAECATLLNGFFDGNLSADQFCDEFTELWMRYRDAQYAVMDAIRATWPEPYDKQLEAQLRSDQITWEEFLVRRRQLWGGWFTSFENMITAIHSACSVYHPEPEKEWELDEAGFRAEVEQVLHQYGWSLDSGQGEVGANR